MNPNSGFGPLVTSSYRPLQSDERNPSDTPLGWFRRRITLSVGEGMSRVDQDGEIGGFDSEFAEARSRFGIAEVLDALLEELPAEKRDQDVERNAHRSLGENRADFHVALFRQKPT